MKSINTVLAKQPCYLMLHRVKYSNHCTFKQDTVACCNCSQKL